MEENKMKKAVSFLRLMGKGIFFGLLIGAVCGPVGALFHHVIDLSGEWFQKIPWFLYLLPVSGLLITFLYRVSGVKTTTDDVIEETQEQGRKVPQLLTVPVIFVSTALTQITGGSAGKEGAALQMGGTIGYHIGKLMHLSEKSLKVTTMCGLAAFFAAVFGTPVTAVVFILEVAAVGTMNYSALVPCTVSSFTAFILSTKLGIAPLSYQITIPEFDFCHAGLAVLTGVVCAGVSILFSIGLSKGHKLAEKTIKDPFLRVFSGAAVILLLTFLAGSRAYNGAGFGLVSMAMNGEAPFYGFLLKMLFTVITISAGYKGGEIVPTLAVGALLGAMIACFTGAESSFLAGLGMIAFFAGMVNCPVASAMLGIELFGSQGLLFYMLAVVPAFGYSGHFGLYHSQKWVTK